ncbi:MAG: hypothetical protein IMF06_05405 [Proteobacteria bacterium]|nr:hypothetical protein [Pseudomonadota bacterium]
MTLFISSFFLIFLLGIQQQNVTHKLHGWSVVTSFAIAAAQVGFIKGTVAGEYVATVLQMGAGGGLGASLSIFVHSRWLHRPRNVIGEEI